MQRLELNMEKQRKRHRFEKTKTSKAMDRHRHHGAFMLPRSMKKAKACNHKIASVFEVKFPHCYAILIKVQNFCFSYDSHQNTKTNCVCCLFMEGVVVKYCRGA